MNILHWHILIHYTRFMKTFNNSHCRCLSIHYFWRFDFLCEKQRPKNVPGLFYRKFPLTKDAKLALSQLVQSTYEPQNLLRLFSIVVLNISRMALGYETPSHKNYILWNLVVFFLKKVRNNALISLNSIKNSVNQVYLSPIWPSINFD